MFMENLEKFGNEISNNNIEILKLLEKTLILRYNYVTAT
jgi:hypothetical protein